MHVGERIKEALIHGGASLTSAAMLRTKPLAALTELRFPASKHEGFFLPSLL